jgi:hypothetical protein
LDTKTLQHEPRKAYVSPETVKHQPLDIVRGSGGYYSLYYTYYYYYYYYY